MEKLLWFFPAQLVECLVYGECEYESLTVYRSLVLRRSFPFSISNEFFFEYDFELSLCITLSICVYLTQQIEAWTYGAANWMVILIHSYES